jgi:hypothetical protein
LGYVIAFPLEMLFPGGSEGKVTGTGYVSEKESSPIATGKQRTAQRPAERLDGSADGRIKLLSMEKSVVFGTFRRQSFDL